MHLTSLLAADAAAVEDVLGTATGALMLALALAVVAAIAFVPLRPRAEQGPLDRILVDIAVIVAIGVALMYLLLNFVGTMIQVYVSSGVRIPGLLFVDIHTPLVGASAGIFGVLIAAAQ